MRQKAGTKQSHGEKVVKDLHRATRKQYSAEEKVATVIADGANDTRRYHNVTAARGAVAIISWTSAQACSTLEANHGGRHRAKRSCEGLQISRTGTLAKADRVSPPEPRRGEDELRQTAWPRPHGSSLRPAGC